MGQLPRSSGVADFYHRAPIMSTTLANFTTVTGSECASVAALSKALAKLTDFVQSQANVDALQELTHLLALCHRFKWFQEQ
jgi:hypothetical protein